MGFPWKFAETTAVQFPHKGGVCRLPVTGYYNISPKWRWMDGEDEKEYGIGIEFIEFDEYRNFWFDDKEARNDALNTILRTQEENE